MKAYLALMQREYYEHRGSFVIAPAALLGLLVVAVGIMGFSSRMRFEYAGVAINAGKFFELGFGVMTMAWWAYLLVALFFYFSDAFSADRRNNAMLFWKSMPQSDLKVLLSKLGAGMKLFPTLVFIAVLLTGFIVYAATLVAVAKFPGIEPLSPGVALSSYGSIALAGLGFFVLGLLWFVPFYAWVGALATVFGRWSMPLAFLVPGVAVGLENLVGNVQGPAGGYIWAYLSRRMEFGIDETAAQNMAFSNEPFSAVTFVADMLSRIDWTMMVTGWVFAAAAIYAASEYRRRVLD